MILDRDTAAGFAQLTLGHIEQQWPYKLDHVMTGPADVQAPVDLHPIFHGSYDWHSCVHGWWQLMRLLRRFPDLDQAEEIRARANRLLVPDKVAGELAYLARSSSSGFERPYGWAWALALHDELTRHEAPWGDAVAPLARSFAERLHGFLPKLTYPIRVGTHFNTAFALVLSRNWALSHDPELVALIDRRSLDWFGGDRDCQAWEPGGDEFLSSALTEALLMSRVLGPVAFRNWFGTFLPQLSEGKPATLFVPAFVSDRDDGKIAHLDGLNLSRGWCWRRIASRLGDDHPASAMGRAAAERHISASLPHLADSYLGSHWLATFALLALD